MSVEARSESVDPQAYPGSLALSEIDLPPNTPLADHGRRDRWLILVVTFGTTIGGVVGAAVMSAAFERPITWAGWMVGMLSCAVLGSWIAFLLRNFGTIARHAWRHAHAHEKQSSR